MRCDKAAEETDPCGVCEVGLPNSENTGLSFGWSQYGSQMAGLGVFMTCEKVCRFAYAHSYATSFIWIKKFWLWRYRCHFRHWTGMAVFFRPYAFLSNARKSVKCPTGKLRLPLGSSSGGLLESPDLFPVENPNMRRHVSVWNGCQSDRCLGIGLVASRRGCWQMRFDIKRHTI